MTTASPLCRCRTDAGPVYAVADGVGGRYNAGLFASMAVQQVLRCAYGVPLRGLVRQIGTELDAVNRAPQVVEGTSGTGIGERGTGATTLLVARSTRSALDVVWVGDSRAYLWTPGDGLTQLTRDQRDGYGTCCLGVNHEVIPDPLEESLPPMVEGERLLLCTDGVSNALPDGRIEAILAATPDAPQDAVNRLLSEVLARGHDNATALVAEAPLAGAEGTRDQTDAFASWFGPDGRVTEAAPGSTITGVESFELLSSLVHNVAFDKKKWGRPVVLVGRDAGTNLLRTLQRDAERFGFEILWLTARDIPTPDELAKALGKTTAVRISPASSKGDLKPPRPVRIPGTAGSLYWSTTHTNSPRTSGGRFGKRPTRYGNRRLWLPWPGLRPFATPFARWMCCSGKRP